MCEGFRRVERRGERRGRPRLDERCAGCGAPWRSHGHVGAGETIKCGRASYPKGVDPVAKLGARYRSELKHEKFRVLVRSVLGGLREAMRAERKLHRRFPVPGRVPDARGKTPSKPSSRRFYVYRVVLG
jgi:hypothetical protein